MSPKEQLKSMDTASGNNPDNIHSIAQKANILMAPASLTQIASDAIQQAVNLTKPFSPSDIQQPEILQLFARICNTARDFPRALAFFKQACIASPRNAAYHNNYAVALQQANEQQQASEAFQETLRLNPGIFSAYWQQAQLDKTSGPDDLISSCELILEQFREKPEVQIYLNFALARSHERDGNYDQSLAHLHRANTTVNQYTPYHLDHDLALFKQLQNSFPISSFDRHLHNDINNDEKATPVFIVGMPRTGTTLVEQLIVQSGEVTSAGELHHFTTLFEAACSVHNRGKEGLDKYKDLEQLNFQELGRHYLKSTHPMAGETPVFIDKHPFNFLLLGAIAQALPQAKFVHVTRNPMDTCFSNYKHLFRLGTARHAYTLNDLSHYYAAYQGLMNHWNQCLPERIIHLSYDQLVETPKTESQRLMQFLDLPWGEETLNFHQSHETVSTPSASQVRQPINRSSQHQWKKYTNLLQPLRDALTQAGVNLS